MFRLRLLLSLHFALGPIFCIWSAFEWGSRSAAGLFLFITVFGIILAQSSLLGFWVVFSPANSWKRQADLLLGCLYLEALLSIATRFVLLAAMATIGTTAVLWLVRWWYVDL